MVNGLFLQPIAFIPLYRKRKRSSIKKKKVNSLNIAVPSIEYTFAYTYKE